MKTVAINQGQQTETYRNKNVHALMIGVTLAHGTVNTAHSGSPLTLSAVQVQVALTRNGKNRMIVVGQLDKLAAASALNTDAWRVHAGNQIAGSYIKLAAAAAAKEIRWYAFPVSFGNIINLKGDDEMKVTVTTGAVMDSATYDANASALHFDLIEGIGYEGGITKGTPYVEIINVDSSQSELNINLGDGVFKVAFINTDKKSVLAADEIITYVRLESDKYGYLATDREFNFRDFLGTVRPSDAYNYQSRIIYQGMALEKATLQLTLTTANLTAGKNALVVWRYLRDPEVFQAAVRMGEKHAAENIENSY